MSLTNDFFIEEEIEGRLLRLLDEPVYDFLSERIVQKCLCDNVLTPILTHPLIYDNGASVKGKGVHFAIRRLIVHLSKFYRQNGFSNAGYALLIDFTKFFDNIRHDIFLR
jgi:hypothetical protein